MRLVCALCARLCSPCARACVHIVRASCVRALCMLHMYEVRTLACQHTKLYSSLETLRIIIKHGYIEDVEAFVDALEPHVFKGENCIEDYCQWVMDEESNITQRKTAKGYDKTICIAHNSRGYDSRFVLKYLDSKSLIPETLRANGGSSIQYIC